MHSVFSTGASVILFPKQPSTSHWCTPGVFYKSGESKNIYFLLHVSCQDVKTSWPINRVITNERANNQSSWRLNDGHAYVRGDRSAEGCICSPHWSAPKIKHNQQKLRGRNVCFPNDCCSCPGHNSAQNQKNYTLFPRQSSVSSSPRCHTAMFIEIGIDERHYNEH